MPARTLLVAAAGAATGIFATAMFYNVRSGSGSGVGATTTNAIPGGAGTPIVHVPRPGNFGSKRPQDEPNMVDPSGLFQYGFPGAINDLAVRKALVSGYDRRTRNPAWVAEHITPESVASKGGDRKHSVFIEDESIPEMFRAKLKDYFRSGYDRGHQVPAADAKWDQQAMDETFYLSNMCPQVGDGFNRDYWAHFEDFCRRLTKSYPSVRIITGPLYLPKQGADGKWRVEYEVVGSPPNVAVPTHFFKVILGEDGTTGGKVAVGAFVLPNAVISNRTPLTEFEVPVEIVERASGLQFLQKLEPARRKQLCAEVQCSIAVREFKKNNEELRKKK
ncbi:mitochondrial nuclease [Peziza echinospora]|nr:mitochondrial nuclease [Peziza echinospora]